MTIPQGSKRVLEPVERLSEVLFGLIMVLTFTGSISVAQAGREGIREMLVGAIGCNLAWGVIDAVFYLMSTLAERGQALAAYRGVRRASDEVQGRELLRAALPRPVAQVIRPEELDSIRERLLDLPEPGLRARLQLRDWRGAVGVFALVFLTTFPPTIPFLFMERPLAALRVSNLIAISMLFAAGSALGRLTGHKPAVFGAAMVVLGGLLVGMTILLGG